ncbi:MAG TPA: hypothetical protein VKT77_11080 [Chthonomonadaceae bacterium]|nr:hypothetical protein [Chthonomonadaceae bacterium]
MKRASPGLSDCWRRAAGIAALASLLAGCARESATTTIHPGGGWTRKASYSISLPEDPKNPKKQPGLRDLFTPPSGSAWKIVGTESKDKPAQATVTAEREVPVGASVIGDLTVKAPAVNGKAAARVVNTCTVSPAGPGRWRYTETFRWTGTRPSIAHDISPLLPRTIQQALPAGFTSAADVRRCTARVQERLWQDLFAPPEPLLLEFYDNVLPLPGLSDPDERQSLLIRRLGPRIERAVGEAFGARMTAGRRHQTALAIARMIGDWTAQNAGSGAKMGGAAGKSAGADRASETFAGIMPIAITLSVKMPGRVVETNGIVDPLAGDVYWTLYPQAAATQGVVLHATFETRPQQAAR